MEQRITGCKSMKNIIVENEILGHTKLVTDMNDDKVMNASNYRKVQL